MKKLKLNKETIAIVGKNAQQQIIGGGISTRWVCANSMQACPTMRRTCGLSCHFIDGMCVDDGYPSL